MVNELGDKARRGGDEAREGLKYVLDRREPSSTSSMETLAPVPMFSLAIPLSLTGLDALTSADDALRGAMGE